MIKTVKAGGMWWTGWSPGVIFPVEGEDPSKVRGYFQLPEGERIDFVVEDDGKGRVEVTLTFDRS